MKRGRPRDTYPDGEFRGVVLQTLSRRSLSLRVLELLSGVNRGTLSAVLNGKRPCERRDRLAILSALGLTETDNDRFLPPDTSSSAEYDRILLDGQGAAHPGIRQAQLFMSRSQFAEAHHSLRSVFEAAIAAEDVALEAEAAGYIGWFHGELERFDDARKWLLQSIRLIEGNLGMKTADIVGSLGTGTTFSAASPPVLETLGRALRVYGKILTVRIIHDLDYAQLPEARRALQFATQLDERLHFPELPHTLRWRAVLGSVEDTSTLQEVDAVLAQSRELMMSGSPGEASLIREQGIVRWQKGRLAKAEDFLLDAKERLIQFADARALGALFCSLSKIALQGSGSPRQMERYALLAASLHPYGYVLRHAVDQMRATSGDHRSQLFATVAAGEPPFDTVHAVLSRVANGSPASGSELLKQNMARLQTGSSSGTVSNIARPNLRND